MGGLKDVARRRGLAQRPLLLLGLLLLLPALAFGFLGWRSVAREQELEHREAGGEAADLVEDRIDRLVARLEALAARESERPYFHYQRLYAPEDTAFQEIDFQPSPLLKTPDDPYVLVWFQWELGRKGAPERPETFGSDDEGLRRALAMTYGPTLRAALADAADHPDQFSGRRVDHALRVVQANEERGKLYEEIQIARQARGPGQDGADPASARTPYLRSFFDRIGDEPVPVRYGPFRHAARAEGLPGPPLVAWRIVRIPASHPGRREVVRDRWLLQGYGLDPSVALPADPETVGRIRLVRADRVPAGLRRGAGVAQASVADALGAPVVGGRHPAEALALVAVPDAAVLDGLARVARARFLWLLAGVMVVVAVGFYVLTRGVRREIALARRKEDFVAAVTHELKTPLAGIRMYADMLREGWVVDEAAAERYATRILDETDRLGHLVDQVLDLAALERGVARAHAVPGDLGTAVTEAVALVESRARQSEVDLEVDTESDLPLVPFDPKLVRALVLNLLDNAIKYSAHAPVKQVRVAVGRDAGGVALTVADRGVGIPTAVQKRLFEPFHRAGDENTRAAPGVGIGLALVKRYVDAHGARIVVASTVGQGTTVTVRFGASRP